LPCLSVPGRPDRCDRKKLTRKLGASFASQDAAIKRLFAP
jgi:hypothetical protein